MNRLTQLLFVILATSCCTSSLAQFTYDFAHSDVGASATNPCDTDLDSYSTEVFVSGGAGAFVQGGTPGCGFAQSSASLNTQIVSNGISGNGLAFTETNADSSATASNGMSFRFQISSPHNYTLEGDATGSGLVQITDPNVVAELNQTTNTTLTGILSPGEYFFRASAEASGADGIDSGGDFSFAFSLAVPEPSPGAWLPLCIGLFAFRRRRTHAVLKQCP